MPPWFWQKNTCWTLNKITDHHNFAKLIVNSTIHHENSYPCWHVMKFLISIFRLCFPQIQSTRHLLFNINIELSVQNLISKGVQIWWNIFKKCTSYRKILSISIKFATNYGDNFLFIVNFKRENPPSSFVFLLPFPKDNKRHCLPGLYIHWQFGTKFS